MNVGSALVNCSAYRGGVKINDITIEEISDVLREENTFVWVGLLEPDFELLRKMQEEFNLHELAIEDARNAHQRPKLEEYGDTLFMVLHTAHISSGDIRFGETHIFVGPRFVLTVRHGASSSYRGVRERCEQQPDRLAKGPGYVLYAIVDFVVDQYQPCMDMLQQQFRTYEQNLFTPDVEKGKPRKDNLHDFYGLKNKLLMLQAAASPLLEIGSQLLRFHNDIIPKDIRVYFRDVQDHVSRVTQTSDRMQEMINSAMQVALAQVTIRQNEVVKRLAGWGAILAVPTMIFSWYGMNFNFMPELEWRWSYPSVMGVIVFGCVVLYRRFRKIGWL